jgi:cytochrome b561
MSLRAIAMKVSTGYSGLQILLHWGIAILIAVNWFVSDGMEQAFDAHNEGAAVAFWPASVHVYVGLAVLALVLIRLVVRFTRGAPAAPAGTSKMLDLAGHASHLALYGLLVLVPLLGASAWYLGYDPAGGWHVFTMNILLIVTGLHAVAALFHQYVIKDRLLLRMMRPS